MQSQVGQYRLSSLVWQVRILGADILGGATQKGTSRSRQIAYAGGQVGRKDTQLSSTFIAQV